MKACDALIAWNGNNEWDRDDPLREQVKVASVPVHPGWADGYRCTGGACMAGRRGHEKWKQIALLFIDFQTLVVNYKIDPAVVHDAFLAIDEYRQRISPDSPGAEDIPDEESD